MNTYLLLLKKDFRAAAPWLIFSAASWLPMFALPALGGMRNSLLVCYVCFVMLGGVTGFLALAKIVHEDSLASPLGFLAAKPVSRTQLLIAKVTLVLVAVALPGVVIRFAAFALAAAEPSFPNLVVLLAQQLVFGMALVGVFLLPALWTSTLSRMIVATFAIAAAFVVLFAAACRILPVSADERFASASVSAGRLILFQLTLIAATLAAALFLAKTRRPIVAGCILCLGLGGGLAIARKWIPSERNLPLVSLPSSRVTINPPPALQRELRDNRTVDTLLLSYEISGVPRDKLLFPTEVTATFGGKAEEKTLHLKLGWRDVLSPATQKSIAIKEWLGIPLDKFDFKSPEILDLAPESETGRPFEGIETGSVRGSIGFTVLEPRVIATLPARVGAEAITPPYRVRILRISANAKSIETQIAIQSLVSPSPREVEFSRFLSNFWIVAKNVNDPAKSLVSSPGSSGSTRVGPLLIQNLTTELRCDENKNIPADWERTTLMQIISTSVVGQTKLRFSTPGQKLPD